MIRTRFALVLTLLAAPLLGQGDPPLDASVVVLPETDVPLVRLLELDGDGILDGLGFTIFDKSQLYLGDGAGGFTATGWSGPSFSSVDVVEVGDLNGDGLDDFVVGGLWNLAPALSDGTGQATELALVSTDGLGIRHLQVADFTGDGLDDMAIADAFKVRIYRVAFPWDPQGLLKTEVELTTSISDLVTAEVTGDGLLDLVAVGPDRVTVLPVGPAGLSIGPAFTTSAGTDGAAGDADGDGLDDVVIFGDGQYQVLAQTAPGVLALGPVEAGGPASELCDVDGDGDLDGVKVANCAGFAGTCIFVARNDGSGRFEAARMVETLWASRFAGASDVDSDGDLELVAGRAVYHVPGGGLPASQTGLADVESYASLSDPDRDGDPDIEPRVDGYLASNGDGSFVTTVPVTEAPPAGTQYGQSFAGDWTGDGKDDLVVQLLDDLGAFLETRLLVGTGGGGYELGGAAAPPGVDIAGFAFFTTSLSPLAADFDSDGDRDLYIREEWSGATATHVWRNDGTGFFTFARTSVNEVVTEVVDLDADGINDEVYTNASTAFDATAYFRLGLGGGSFGAGQLIFAGVNPFDRLGVDDFDNDGDLDFLVLHEEGQIHLDFKENVGGGVFVDQLDVFPSPGFVFFSSARVFAVDVDGDGKKDTVVYPSPNEIDGLTSVSLVLRWVGPGLTYDPEPLDLVMRPRLAADLDGDGDGDLLGDRFHANRTFDLPASGSRRQYGPGSPGTGGMVPTLGAVGPFRAGETIELRVTGSVGGTQGFLVLGTQEAALGDVPFPGLTLLVEPVFAVLPISIGGAAGGAGAGEWSFPFFVQPSLSGQSFTHQVFAIDPAAPHLVNQTNGLEILYGG